MAKVLLPLSYYALLLAGLGFCLHLFVLLKREIRRLEARWGRRHQALEETIRKMQADINETKARLRQAEEQAELLLSPPPRRAGVNLSKRTQALRMFTRGQSPQHIAAALSLSESEVQWLLKAQRLVQ